MRTCFLRLASPSIALTALAGGLLMSSAAAAATYEICASIKVQNTDSEQTNPTGITEDYYLTSSTQTFPGRGFFVKAVSGNITLVAGYTDPNTGCIEFTDVGGNIVADIQVQSIARHGTNYIRAHDGGSSGSSALPGDLFAVSFLDRVLAPGVTETVEVPSNSTWNAFATASYALWRVSTGLTSKIISMGFDNAGSSSIFPGATSWIEDDAHLIRVNNASRRLKFEVVHELGHAVARLNYGHDGAEDDFDDTFAYTGTTAQGCKLSSSDGYSQRSVEWDSMGFKEGFANLYVARVFNDRDDDGAILLTGTSYSLERFQSASLGNPAGGHVLNHCYAGGTPTHGVSTTEDWTRFLWDLYTIPTATCGSPQIGLDEMYAIYNDTRDLSPTGVDAWHTDIMTAIVGNGTLSSCEKDEAESFANWNRIGGTSHVY